MTTIAETPRLIIREFLPNEQETYLRHFTDELVLQYIPKRSREERIAIFQKAVVQYAVTKKLGIWGIFNKADGNFIGSCLLRRFDINSGAVELGYSLERKYWGMGIATEMAKAMIAHGFSDINTREIVAVTILANTGSQNVLEKAGLKRVDNLVRDSEELAYFKIFPDKP